MSQKYERPYRTPSGYTTVKLKECKCNNQRGPRGGVCGCGGAILSESEENWKRFCEKRELKNDPFANNS